MYHALLGAWLQRDPLGYVDGMSLYEYCKGWPTGGLDPQGLGFWTWVGKTALGAISGAIVGGVIGLAGGPAGLLAGAIAGGVAGAINVAVSDGVSQLSGQGGISPLEAGVTGALAGLTPGVGAGLAAKGVSTVARVGLTALTGAGSSALQTGMQTNWDGKAMAFSATVGTFTSGVSSASSLAAVEARGINEIVKYSAEAGVLSTAGVVLQEDANQYSKGSQGLLSSSGQQEGVLYAAEIGYGADAYIPNYGWGDNDKRRVGVGGGGMQWGGQMAQQQRMQGLEAQIQQMWKEANERARQAAERAQREANAWLKQNFERDCPSNDGGGYE